MVRRRLLYGVQPLNVIGCGLRTPPCHVTLQRAAGGLHAYTHAHMAEQPIFLDVAGGVSSGAPEVSAEGGDPVGGVAAISGPRATLASARYVPPKRRSTASSTRSGASSRPELLVFPRCHWEAAEEWQR